MTDHVHAPADYEADGYAAPNLDYWRDRARRADEGCAELREVLEAFPGYAADITFEDVWQWLAKRDAALGIIHPPQIVKDAAP